MQATSFPTDGQTIRLISLPEVMRLTGCGRTSIYDGIGNGTFPKHTKCGTASRWVESEILAWNAARVAERDRAAA
jgi:prophage regulatory protein